MKIEIRAYTSQIPISEITQLLHRAYQRLADLGLRYTATWQDDNITRDRISRGQTYLAFDELDLVGTITLEDQAITRGCTWYDRPEVASFHQFAVDPAKQGLSIGRQLLNKAESEARSLGAKEIALDTAEWAYHLISMYLFQGYRFVDEVQWDTTNYRSVILSKDLYLEYTGKKEIRDFLRQKPSVEHAQILAELEQIKCDDLNDEERARHLSQLREMHRCQWNCSQALDFFEKASVVCVQNNLSQLLFVNRLRTAIAYQ